jgi:hypothetical protein
MLVLIDMERERNMQVKIMEKNSGRHRLGIGVDAENIPSFVKRSQD